jgi:branched-chain amino acid transport system substrate-binding protein
VILPHSGSADLAIYADYIGEGVALAAARYPTISGRVVELALRDDSGAVAAAERISLDLEADGVLAIVGPLMSDAFTAIVARRTDPRLPILSPTATDLPVGSVNTYSLNAPDTRGASALANWSVRRGTTRFALLYPTDPEYASLAIAFRVEAERVGATIVADLPFEPETMTFSTFINDVRASRAQAVYIPASERQIRQLAPQLRYFGLTGVEVLGNESRVSEEVRRTVGPDMLEGTIASTPMPPDSSLTGWPDFVRAYEARYRRTLDNPYPALGYDAASLAFEGIRLAGGRREAVADALTRIRDFRGATGVLSIEGGRVTRRPYLVRIRAGTPELIAGGGGP